MFSILTATTLFPNQAKPTHGSFVATRLAKLVASGQVRAEIMAPVPWIPPLLRYPHVGRLDLVPAKCQWQRSTVWHPRYLVLPKIGMTVTPYALYLAMRRRLSILLRQGRRFDLIDAHYFYPDGAAAVRLGREFGIPVVVTARGTDINLIPDWSIPRRMICEAAVKADGLIAVCQALKDRMVELGIADNRIKVLRNGVDLDLFRPEDRESARRGLGFQRRTLLSVGHLIERKGHHLVIGALPQLPDMDLVIVGEGPVRAALEKLGRKLGVANRLRFLGSLSQFKLAEVYRAADALVLASSREGWANVLLEAMASGTPVIASAIWGTPEVVADPDGGVLMKSLDCEGVRDGVRRLFENPPTRWRTRAYAERFSWDETTRGQLELFHDIIDARQARHVPTHYASARVESPRL